MEEQTPQETQPKATNQTTTEVKKLSNKQIATLIIAMIFLFAFIAFVAQNWNRVGVEFLFWRFQIRIIFLIALSAIAGGVVTFALMKYFQHRKNKK